MAAVMTTPRLEHPRLAHPRLAHPRPVRALARPRLTPVAAPEAVGRRARASAATYWRRRVAVAVLSAGIVVGAGQAGRALGGSPLATPGRRPPVVAYVVRPGDSLWTVARRLAPGEDPRPVVDALAAARRGTRLLPGETVVWPRG